MFSPYFHMHIGRSGMISLNRIGLLAIVISFMMIGQAASADSVNLVRNSDFERCFTSDGTADGWVASRTAQGGVNARVPGEGIDVGACHRLMAPGDAPVEFYICSSVVRGLSPGDRGVVSVYVRANDVRDGHGAYAGLAYYNAAGKRISFTDTSVSLRGSTNWERLSQTFIIPPGTVRVEMNLVLHGRGTADFDEAQVEKGDSMTDWKPKEGSISGKTSGKPVIAIFKDDIPPSGTASNPVHLRKMAEATGYRAELVNSTELADPAWLSTSRYDVLIMPYGGSFPANAATSIKSFLEDGGSLLNIGGYPFDKPLVRAGGKWINPDDVEPNPTDLQLLIDPATTGIGWTTGGRDIKDHEAKVIEDSGRKCIPFGTKSMPSGGWVTLGAPPIPGLPPDSKTLVFRARSLQPDVMLSIEVVERDGSRWRSILPLSTKWHIYQVDLASLEYWHDNPSVGRGESGDMAHPADVTAVRFGITTEFSVVGKAHEACIAEIWTSAKPLEVPTYLHMNSATGGVNPATFLAPDPSSISICDAGSLFSDAVTIASTSAVRDDRIKMKLPSEIRGWSATGQTAFGGPGSPLKARWSPIADALDRYGRKRGTALAMMWNFGGSYPGSAWAYSGISNVDLFKLGNKSGEILFKSVLDRLAKGVFVYDAIATPACVRKDETVKVKARIGSMSASAVKASISLKVLSGRRLITQMKKTVEIPIRGSAPVEFEFNPPPATDGLLTFRLTVDAHGCPSDVLDCGAVVWNPDRQAQGAKLDYRDCYMDKGRGPEFLLGTQIYWGNNTITGSDPLRWEEQLRRMADNGILISRSFMNMPGGDTEDGWRRRDSMVQLAQEAGISLFYEGISTATEDSTAIEKDSRLGNKVAERYRSAPGMFVDIRNEPTLPVTAKGPDAQKLMSAKMRDWAARIRESIVSVDPKRLVSVGYLNALGYGEVAWDPIEGSRDLDFTNRHYYGPLPQYSVEVKQIDNRLLGKAPSTGEFGCTSHPGLRTHFVYETEADAAVRYGYTPHSCFGLGGIFVSNWHWQDPIEDIFPCGLLLSDGAIRDRMQPYRNSGALFRMIRPQYQHPALWFVIPDSRLGPDKQAVEEAMNRCIRTLLGLHVEFGVVQEQDLGKLPSQCKALIWPSSGASDTDVLHATLRIPETIQSPEEIRSLMAGFFAKSGVKRHALTPDVPELQSFRVPGENGSVAHVLWNTSDKPIRAALTDLPKPITIDLAPHTGGFAAFDGRGQLVAVEGRSITIGGKTVLAGDTTIGAVSLDGSGLFQGKGMLLLPYGPGKVRFNGVNTKSVVSVGEISGGKWVEYERVMPLNGSITLDASMARSWLVVGIPDQMPGLTSKVVSNTVPPNVLR